MAQMFSVAAIFSNHMVLQRDKGIRVWGKGSNGDVVTVQIADNKVKAVIKDEKWMAILPSMKAGGPVELSITCKDEIIRFSDVLLGDVWLAGGQSNMELELQNCKNGKEELANANHVNIRVYNTLRNSYTDEKAIEAERNNSWFVCGSDTAATMSAVGYFYAKELVKELDVPIGIIGCNWGGTSASAWISREWLEKDEDTRTYVDEYEEVLARTTLEEYEGLLAKYVEDYDIWRKISDKLFEEEPQILWEKVIEIAGECPWPEPLGPKSPFRAAGLYETMLKRIVPYTLKGFIYYQGESDDHKPTIYSKLLSMLIEQWRHDFMDYELPFLFVQLPMYIARGDVDRKNWPIIREQQMKVHKTIKNTGLAVILDCGEYGDIHPLDKQSVGYRLALQSLLHVYHKEVEAYGPLYDSMEIHEDRIALNFKYVDGGFVLDGEEANGFEIAGVDEVFYKAEVQISGEQIIVKSNEVENPRYVRYQWANYDKVSIFNKNKLPLAPFRTNEFMKYEI